MTTLVFSGPKHPRKLGPARYPELGVGAGEVAFHRFQGHVQLVGDLAVGAALGRQGRDPQLARGEGLHTGAPLAPGARPGGLELLAGPAGQAASAAADGQLQRLGERLTGSGAPTGAAQRRPQLGQRIGKLEPGRGTPEAGHRFVEQLDAELAPSCESGNARCHSQRPRGGEHAHVGQLRLRHPVRGIALAEPQQRLGRAGAGVQVADVTHLRAPHLRR